MPFLSVSEKTLDALNLQRQNHETDDQLINRLLEHARAHMIIKGAIPMARARARHGEAEEEDEDINDLEENIIE